MLHNTRLERLTRDKHSSLAYARLSQYIRLERLARNKHSRLSGLFISYEEWGIQARVSHYIRLERLARDKHSRLLGPLISYKDWIQFFHTGLESFASEKYCYWVHSYVMKNGLNKLECSAKLKLERLAWNKYYVIGPIHNLRRKWSAVNAALAVCLTYYHRDRTRAITLYFFPHLNM